LELSPPTTPIPATKNNDGDSLKHSLMKTQHNNNSNKVKPSPFDVQALHERTLNRFHQKGDDDITFKRHSTHDAIIHAKRRDTTMGILPLHSTEYGTSSNISAATSSNTMDPSSMINGTSQQNANSDPANALASITRHGSTSTLTRHNTTGHALLKNKNKKPVTELSEEFQKELTARRKAFRRLSRRKKDIDADDDDRVMIGTRIGEGHQNYVLMYNMLTGIRIAVGRVSAKIDRPLVLEDFSAAHKLAFDV
jgi:hypothetical protein